MAKKKVTDHVVMKIRTEGADDAARELAMVAIHADAAAAALERLNKALDRLVLGETITECSLDLSDLTPEGVAEMVRTDGDGRSEADEAFMAVFERNARRIAAVLREEKGCPDA